MDVDVTEPTPDLRETRRRQILDAAAHVFARQGFAATRIHDVAAHAGVAYGLVYHYFGTKQALLATVFDASWEAFADALEGIAASPRTPPDQLRAALDYLFGAWEVHPDVVRVVVLEYGPRLRSGGQALADHPHVGRALAAISRIFHGAGAAGLLRPGLAPEALPALFMGALEGAFAAVVHDPAATPALRNTLRTLFRDVLFRTPPVPSSPLTTPPEAA